MESGRLVSLQGKQIAEIVPYSAQNCHFESTKVEHYLLFDKSRRCNWTASWNKSEGNSRNLIRVSEMLLNAVHP